MNKEKLKLFKDKLNGMIENLEGEVSTTLNGMRDDGVAFPDPTDRASLESERNLTLRIRDRERMLRLKVKEALEKIDDGTFGICEVCEEEIEMKRLEARPVTTLCLRCKEEQEQGENDHNSG